MIRLYEILVRFRPRIILPILTRLAFPTPHPHGLIKTRKALWEKGGSIRSWSNRHPFFLNQLKLSSIPFATPGSTFLFLSYPPPHQTCFPLSLLLWHYCAKHRPEQQKQPLLLKLLQPLLNIWTSIWNHCRPVRPTQLISNVPVFHRNAKLPFLWHWKRCMPS